MAAAFFLLFLSSLRGDHSPFLFFPPEQAERSFGRVFLFLLLHRSLISLSFWNGLPFVDCGAFEAFSR